MSQSRRCEGCRARTKQRARTRKFKPFLPLIVMAVMRSLEENMDKLGALMW